MWGSLVHRLEDHRTIANTIACLVGLRPHQGALGMAENRNSASDFVLFPREQRYSDPLDSRAGDEVMNMQYNSGFASDMHRHEDFSDRAIVPYESYPPVTEFTSAYYSTPNTIFHAEKQAAGQSVRQVPSSGSPSPSISHNYDHAPSTLSSTSGASAHSTASSADGSPYVNATNTLPYQEKWLEPLHGLGIGPEIATGEDFNNDSYPASNFDHDIILERNKFANYIGEYENHISSSSPNNCSKVSSISPTSPSQCFVPAPSPPNLALDTRNCQQNITIDSILEEANHMIDPPSHLISPVSAVPKVASSTFSPDRIRNIWPCEPRPSFRSPRTPASATSRFPSCAGSSSDSSDPSSKRAVLNGAKAKRRPSESSNRTNPDDRLTYPFPYEKSQNQFFVQSSGRFVAPLESTCWFSSPFPVCFPDQNERRPLKDSRLGSFFLLHHSLCMSSNNSLTNQS